MATYNGDPKNSWLDWLLSGGIPEAVLMWRSGVRLFPGRALRCIGKRITVVEIEEKIIEWNRTHLSAYSGNALDNPKVKVVNADFIEWMKNSREKFDVICMDIDNGPDWVVMDDNNKLYSDAGIRNILKILNKSGVVSFWSAAKSDTFEQALRKWFYSVSVTEAGNKKGGPDYIYLATNPRT